jgi:hypothetical protein
VREESAEPEVNESDGDLPSCEHWQIWVGHEVEGETERGSLTLFIRKNLTQKDLDVFFAQYLEMCRRENQRFTRIWFTKEFLTWQVFRYAKTIADIVCLEVEIIEYFPQQKVGRKLPLNLFHGVQLYVKIPLQLRRGDHVCIGYAFEDEAFLVGSGRKVSPRDYRDDVKLA